MKSKNEYPSAIDQFSHEIRNPLTAVSSTVQILQKKYPEICDDKFFQALDKDVRFMIELVADFSKYTVEKGFRAETFAFDAVMKEIALCFATSIAEQDITFTSKIDITDYSFFGDPIQIQQLFRNLLGNAADAVTGRAQASIFLHAYTEDNRLVVTVEDNGCGIAGERIPTLFDPFVTYKIHGSGLGLSICRHIASTHHGTIEVSSVLGEGSTFKVSFPAENQGGEHTGE